jgi:hypothetical protein
LGSFLQSVGGNTLQMNNLEKFGLWSGIIGLVADVIAILSFLAGGWQPTAVDSGRGQMPFLFQAVFAFLIVYGWFSISWVLVRRAYLARKYTKQKFMSAAFKIVFAVGLVILPLVVAWWVVILMTDAAQQSAEIANRKIAQATQSALTTPTPVPTNSNGQTSPIVNPRNTEERVDVSGWYCVMIPAEIAIAIGIFLAIIFMMPVIYSDMPEITSEDVFGT